MNNALTLITAASTIGAATYYYNMPIMPTDAELTENWSEMPDGKFYHNSCIHNHGTEFHADRSNEGTHVVTENGSEWMADCEHKPFTKPVDTGFGKPFSGLSISTEQSSPEGRYAEFKSEWVVPPNPKDDGPGNVTTIFLFNSLEDGGSKYTDSTVKLQPVLQWGQSACLKDPITAEAWNIITYLTAGGRVHCGARVSAVAGHTVVGLMKESEIKAGDWEVVAHTIESEKKVKSRYSLRLPKADVVDAAYIGIELEKLYTCNSYPATP